MSNIFYFLSIKTKDNSYGKINKNNYVNQIFSNLVKFLCFIACFCNNFIKLKMALQSHFYVDNMFKFWYNNKGSLLGASPDISKWGDAYGLSIRLPSL